MKALPILVLGLLLPAAASACDLCAVYASLEAKESAKGWYGGGYQQFTHFGTLRRDGSKVENPLGQRLDSSITQLFVGYQVADTFGLQANIPYVERRFRRPEGGALRSGVERGLGDAVLLAHWRPLLEIRADTVFALTLLGGVKLPTGSSDRIAEELAEGDGEEAGVPSGIHGHDLALGSGSLDGILGFTAFYRWRRLVANVSAQASLRRTGDFDYRYANDVAWSLVPGWYVDLSHENTLATGLALSGEHKGQDTLAGVRTDDTAIDALYLGPDVTFSRGATLYAELAADFPLRQHDAALQAVPDYRIRLAITWRP